MTFTQDFFSLLGAALAMFAVKDRALLTSTIIGGIVLAALCWWACCVYARLWNKKFRVIFLHHVFCALASVLTLVTAVTYVALRHAGEVAAVSVAVWEQQIAFDKQWSAKTFKQAYDRVKALGIEDFTGYPSPPVGQIIPTTSERAQLEYALTYARSAAAHFKAQRPFLNSILQTGSEVPAEVLRADIRAFFAGGGKLYQGDKAIHLVAAKIKEGLQTHLPRVLSVFRSCLIGLFLLGQLVAFGLVGWAAYRDLKVRT
jgi:hypothetical protein